MKSSWMGIGFSHHSVPSLSKTAIRSSGGTAQAVLGRHPPDEVQDGGLAAPSRQLGRITARRGPRFPDQEWRRADRPGLFLPWHYSSPFTAFDVAGAVPATTAFRGLAFHVTRVRSTRPRPTHVCLPLFRKAAVIAASKGSRGRSARGGRRRRLSRGRYPTHRHIGGCPLRLGRCPLSTMNMTLARHRLDGPDTGPGHTVDYRKPARPRTGPTRTERCSAQASALALSASNSAGVIVSASSRDLASAI